MFDGLQTFDLAINGVNIRGVTAGNGPPLLLLHGYPQSHLIWRRLAPQLAQHCTVVATDLRGYGHSENPLAVPITKGTQNGTWRAIRSV